MQHTSNRDLQRRIERARPSRPRSRTCRCAKVEGMIFYYGGGLNPPPTRLWLSADEAFAGGFAELHESPLWKVTLRLRPSDIVDVTDREFDAVGVADGIARRRHSGVRP